MRTATTRPLTAALLSVACTLGVAGVVVSSAGCKSPAPGVSASPFGITQQLASEPSMIADAAEEILQDMDLRDVTASSTALDSLVSGTTALGKDVKIKATSIGSGVCEVKINSAIGQGNAMEILRRINQEVGGSLPPAPAPTPTPTGASAEPTRAGGSGRSTTSTSGSSSPTTNRTGAASAGTGSSSGSSSTASPSSASTPTADRVNSVAQQKTLEMENNAGESTERRQRLQDAAERMRQDAQSQAEAARAEAEAAATANQTRNATPPGTQADTDAEPAFPMK